MKVLVTGAAGFIGMHTAARLLRRGDEIIGIAYGTVIIPTRLHQWTIEHKPKLQKVEIRAISDNAANAPVFLDREPIGALAPVEFCQ